MDPQGQELLHRYACMAFARQQALDGIVGEQPWKFELNRGVLSFGKDLEFSAQILGTESEKTKTWLWSWANSASDIPEKLMVSARRLRQQGERSGVKLLTTPQLKLSETDGHQLSMIATGLLDASAYYRGPYEGGAIFLLVDDPRIVRRIPATAKEMQRFFDEFTSRIDVADHEKAYRAFLDDVQWRFSIQDGDATFPNSTDVVTVTPDGVELHAYFDEAKAYLAFHKKRPGPRSGTE